MRDLSLHILDLLENSTRAGASEVYVQLAAEPALNRMEIIIDDNGPGLSVAPEVALDPFYTTKNGKRTGLGLSLFAGTAERAGGRLVLSRSPHGGLRVHATFELANVDRLPLGDLPATIATVACTHPDLDISCRVSVADKKFSIRRSELRRGLSEKERDDFTVARHMSDAIARGLASFGVSL